jgi:hypothetical protein
MLPHYRTILCYKRDSLPLPLSTISRIVSTRKALRGAWATKKKRLGEILRERNQVSVENLDKAIQDQQGKLVHQGELLLQRGAVSKPDLVSVLVETSRIPCFDCHSVQVDSTTLSLISATMARKCCALPLETVGNKLVSRSPAWKYTRAAKSVTIFLESASACNLLTSPRTPSIPSNAKSGSRAGRNAPRAERSLASYRDAS